MKRRYVSIWFRYLKTDWFTIREPHFAGVPFVLYATSHGRMIITSANAFAVSKGIFPGSILADARAIEPGIHAMEDKDDLEKKLLKRIAEWCIRFTPLAAVDAPSGIMMDVTGCTHLWGGDVFYLREIINRFQSKGYSINAAIADTPGAAWAIARFSKTGNIIEPGQHLQALLPLPPAALRLSVETVEHLTKLGLTQISQFSGMPRSALRRRFGQELVHKLNQAFGYEEEQINPAIPPMQYHERLNSLEPIVTATGIHIATEQLLETLCTRLQKEEKGLRKAILKCYRVDGKLEQVGISTTRASSNPKHLFKLFENKSDSIQPGEGIELFVLEAPVVEEHAATQEKMWTSDNESNETEIAELLDRVAGRVGEDCIHRFVPDEHYWPERSFKPAASINDKPTNPWRMARPRPMQLLSHPEPIGVAAPIPDYPPMLFRYKGVVHNIRKADGPERIEQEWWLNEGEHRDYYSVEDEHGQRFWLFRSGHYDSNKTYQWFIHGFFA